jgi:hypothetical protein
MRFYFASRIPNIKKVRPNSVLSSNAPVVYNLNRYDFKTGEVWKRDDLETEYNLTPKIKFKKNRTPNGHPFLYRGVITNCTIKKGNDFPKIFKNKYLESVERVKGTEYIDLIHSKNRSDYTNFN